MIGWTATVNEVHIRITDKGNMSVTGGEPGERNAVGRLLYRCFTDGWPCPPGFSIDQTPGFDPAWMYARLVAIGATDVTGPNPAADLKSPPDDPDVIVG